MLLHMHPAMGASFESLISPGPLTELHAEFESECESCHENFDQSRQSALCLDCHEDIAADITRQEQFHGRNPAVDELACRSCHTDHQGRDKDITGLIPETFDHSLTEFELVDAHANAACGSCHTPDEPFRGTADECIDCHREDDRHDGGLGETCADCHTPAGWSEVTFEHDTATDFVLVGEHKDQSCSSCHVDNHFEDTPDGCVDCHKLDDVHNGTRGSECEQCHTPADWQTSEFDHAQETDFELVGAHSKLECASCHLTAMSLPEPPTTCVGCHSADDVHQGKRGAECGECHTSNAWKVDFDHADETGFALLGSHMELTCDACHTESLEAPLSTSCEGCHTEDDPHEESLGACDSCHSVKAWREDIRFDHEFTSFPLVGLHQLASCDQCHDSQVFNTATQACAGCHLDDDKHEGSFGESCSDCHTPGGWELWQFDHDNQTAFVLSGSHSDLLCASCHNPDLGLAENTSTDCVSCHLADDIHAGQFGNDCQRCHSTESFDDTARIR